jgi:hypothetical protein
MTTRVIVILGLDPRIGLSGARPEATDRRLEGRHLNAGALPRLILGSSPRMTV